MSILSRHYRRSQLIALPMPGGKGGQQCYGVNVPNGLEIVSHSFVEWAVDDWRREVEGQLCERSTDFSETTTANPSESSDGSERRTALFTCEKGIRTNVLARSISFNASLGK